MMNKASKRSASSDRKYAPFRTAKALMLALVVSAGVFTAAHADPALIVAIGADNVNGKGKGKSYPGGVGRNEAFPAQLESLLRAQQIDAKVVNEGQAGDTTAGMLKRLDSAVPDGTKLVILDVARGNDSTSGGNGSQDGAIANIKAQLDARHIALLTLPNWQDIPGLMANRDPDGHHFTAQGHAAIAAYLSPKVKAFLAGQPIETVAGGDAGQGTGQGSRRGNCQSGASTDGCGQSQASDPSDRQGGQRDRSRRRERD
jgi:acyl-CoA thioesterase I